MKVLVIPMLAIGLLCAGCSGGQADLSNEKSPSAPTADEQKKMEQADNATAPGARKNQASTYPKATVGEGDALK